MTIDSLGEHFNISISVSDGQNEADNAVIMVTLEPILEYQTMAPKFSHVTVLLIDLCNIY